MLNRLGTQHLAKAQVQDFLEITLRQTQPVEVQLQIKPGTKVALVSFQDLP